MEELRNETRSTASLRSPERGSHLWRKRRWTGQRRQGLKAADREAIGQLENEKAKSHGSRKQNKDRADKAFHGNSQRPSESRVPAAPTRRFKCV